jgi:hypothetical protein
MLAWVLLLLVVQGVPVSPSQAGSISGVLTTSTGKPAVGVRVSALTRPDNPVDAFLASAMTSLAMTDQSGAYRLENVPPGRYYIVAGRIDLPTFYPGTLEMATAKDVLITPGAAITAMNFSLKDNSVGRADMGAGGTLLPTSWAIPLRVTMEGGGKLPVYADGMFPMLRLTRIGDGQTLEAGLTSTSLSVPLAAQLDYRVSVENLSKRYVVKSIVSDKINLLTDVLSLPAPLPPVALSAVQGATAPVTGTSQTGITSIRITNGATGNIISIMTPQGVTSFTSFSSSSFIPPLPPVPTIEVVLAEVSGPTLRTGATLSGKIVEPFQRTIEAAGIPGSIYEDGTFEVKNVPPGRQTLLTSPAPRPHGASIMVGDEDIVNIQLQPILEMPRNAGANFAATLRGNPDPGTIITLASVRGHLTNESTGAKFDLGRTIGRITVNGNTVSYTINNVGEFEIQSLLPGRYDLDLWVFGGNNYSRTLEVRDENMNIEWSVSVPD